MIRLLLLIDQSCDFQTRRCAEQLTGGLGKDFDAHVQTIGRGGTFAHLPEAILRLGRQTREVDLIHAFGSTALSAAAMGSSAPLAYTPAPECKPAAMRWLRAVQTYRNPQVICATATQRRLCVEHGIPIERCHLIRPGVEFSRIQRRRDADLRARLGFADDDCVILAAGESTRSADHRAAAWAASICHVLDPRHRLLLWGRGTQAGAVARFGQALGQPRLVRLAEQHLGAAMEFERLLSAADCVLVSAADMVATLPIAICMAAALPIVATVSPSVAELLEDRHTAAMTRAGSPKALAQRLEDVRADARLAWSISDVARTEAYEYFSQSRFLEQHRSTYRQIVAGKPVEVPEPLPGAGRKFHARV